MVANFKKKKNIFSLVTWIIAVIDAGLLAGLFSYSDNYGNQLVDAAVYGYLIITSILFASICLEENIPDKTFYCIVGPGAIIYILSGTLILFDYASSSNHSSGVAEYYNDKGHKLRIILGGIFALANGIILLTEFILLLVKKDVLEANSE